MGWKVRGVYTHTHIYIYNVCVCVRVYVCLSCRLPSMRALWYVLTVLWFAHVLGRPVSSKDWGRRLLLWGDHLDDQHPHNGP